MSDNYPSGWAIGWSAFAGSMLLVAGTLQILDGLVALFNDEFYVRLENYTYKLDVTAWGWIHLLMGIVLVAAGVGIFKGHVFGRTVGVIAASLSLIANFMWLPYYPVWSIIIIAICIAIIWALTAHGRDIAVVTRD